MADLIGQKLGQYEIIALLGSGGMASVYRARQLNIRREVAIKVIKPDLIEREEFVKRFEREAETVATLSHPHIVKMFDYGHHADLVYLVMELLTGGSLAELIWKGPISTPQVTQQIEQIGSALDYAHRRGIVHRDLKPQNVLLDEGGNVFLTDFGIAKLVKDSTRLTQTGATMGTPAYMAPEQWQGDILDARTDLYSLGIMLYEMLTGKLPFNADTPASMMYYHLQGTPASIRSIRSDLPPGIEPVLLKALAKDRYQRFASAGELVVAFKAALSGQNPVIVPPLPVSSLSDERTLIADTEQGHVTRAPTIITTAAQPSHQSRGLILVLSILLIVAVIGVVLAAVVRSQSDNGNGTATLLVTSSTLSAVQPTADPTSAVPPSATTAAPQPTVGLTSAVPPVAPTVIPQPTATATPLPTTIVPTTNPPTATFTATNTASPAPSIAPSPKVTLTPRPNPLTVAAQAMASLTKPVTPSNTWTATATDTPAPPTATQTPVPPNAGTPVAVAATPVPILGTATLALSSFQQAISASNAQQVVQLGQIGSGHPTGLSWSPDEKLLAVGDVVGEIRLYQADNLTAAPRLLNGRHANQVDSLAFSPDGTLLASVSFDQTVRLWSPLTGNLLLTLTGHTDQVYSVAFSPDGTNLASAGADGTIRFWDIKTGLQTKMLVDYTGWIGSIAFSPDGSTLVSGGGSTVARLWDVRSGKQRFSMNGHTGAIRKVAFSPDGKLIASGGDDYTIRLWNAQTGDPVSSLTGHTGTIWGLQFTPDSQMLVSGSADQTVQLWDIKKGQSTQTFVGAKADIWRLTLNTKGTRIAATSLDGAVHIWEVSSKKELPGITTLYSAAMKGIAFSTDGTELVTGGKRFLTQLWSVKNGAPLATLTDQPNWINAVTFSPDGKLLASSSGDKTTWIRDAKTLKQIRILPSSGQTLAFSPDSKLLATISVDDTKKITVWNVQSGTEYVALIGHTDDIADVAFSPDGSLLASVSTDKTVRLWNVKSGNLVTTLTGHTEWVGAVAFSPNGALLASAGGDKTIRLWDVKSGNLVTTLTGHSNSIWRMTFSPNGEILASASFDGTLRLWDVKDVKNARQLASLPHTEAVLSVAFSPDGTLLASDGFDGVIRLWAVSSNAH